MAGAFLLGVDLGTSNTVAVLRWPDGHTRPLLFDGAELLPSAAFVDAAGVPSVGRDAVRAGRADPGRYEPNPKRRIDEETVLLGVSVPVVELLAAVLRRVADEAVRVAGELPPVVLTHPADWGAPRRDRLATAAARAGLTVAALLPEPVAAAAYFTAVLASTLPADGVLAVLDVGAGTTDAALVRLAPGGYQVLATAGLADLGGLDLDAALVDRIGTMLPDAPAPVDADAPAPVDADAPAPVEADALAPVEADRTGTPASGPPTGSTEGAASDDRPAVVEGAAPWMRLTEPSSPEDHRDRWLFWDDVRGAKEALSRLSSAPVHVPGAAALHLTRGEFEEVARPRLDRVVELLAGSIADAGLSAPQLTGVFLVGGASRVPMLAALLHERLGIAPVVLEQPELVVAEGALRVPPPPAGALPPQPPAWGAAPPAARRRIGYLMAVLVLAVLLLAAGGTTAVLGVDRLTSSPPTSWPDASVQAATATASKAVPAVLGYDYRSLDADVAAARKWCTGSMRANYTKTMTRLRKDISERHAMVSAQAKEIGVVSSATDTVTLLAYVDLHSTNRTSTEARLDQIRVRLVMRRTGDGWRIEKLESL
ncbi:Hsp70 family protein [Actinocatenispora sera]|uniref:Hsp70 protein n=1 Tax=Actinocatenispora sera TaxID=390989 RepID=A0A810L6N4_9ACTN|nr:Hsp70 family protein [Actinocatenispora sera]BCJ30983.1 hypothetical protein Asera_50910 [Actinocatenispora sera]